MKQKIFKLLADLRFSIFLLLLISFCSILGTIIEQDQTIEIYKMNYPITNPIFGFLSWDRIIQFGLDHVYRTWWFIILILLFGLSLTLCSFLQQLPLLKISRRCQFFRTLSSFNKLKLSTYLNTFSFNQILFRIKEQNYLIFQQKNIIYCYKGLLGQLSPIVVHFSMILILFGTVIGSLFGFKAQEIVPKTDSFHIQNILTNSSSTVIPKTFARINDFWITYKKEKTISQFYSDLSILDSNGNEISRKTISVNYPLITNKIYYYQTDWNLIGLRVQISDNQIIEYPLVDIFKTQNKGWLTWISNTQNIQTGNIFIIENLEGYGSIYNSKGLFIGNLELNENKNFNNSFSLLEVISSTGLQIKMDPGIPIIYLGFLFLMISTLISYITYSQIWVIKKNQQLFIGGVTNRATFEFDLEFFKFIK